jgi:hypothetical protein
VADFGEPKAEWAIDRIMSHKGRRADTVFEIQWKTGDKTWLPYDRVEKLDALAEYFQLLGVENVSELGDGSGRTQTSDPQVFLGHLFSDQSTEDIRPGVDSPRSPLIPVPNDPRPNIFGLSSSPHLFLLMAPLLRRAGFRRFIVPSPLGTAGDNDLVVLADTVRMYLEYDGYLRAGTAHQHPTPFGYGDFALAFNMQPAAEADPSRFAIEGTAGLNVEGPSPTLVELIGVDDPAPPTNNTPRMPEGGRYLTPQRAELMEEALWLNMETTKKKREWRDRSVAERWAKKLRTEVSGLSMGRDTHRRVPITPTPGAATSSSNLASTPTANNDGRAMDVEDDGRNDKDKPSAHDPSKKPKK